MSVIQTPLLFASFSDVSTSSKNFNAPSPKSFIISDQFTFQPASNNETTRTSDSVETTQTSDHEFCGHDEETSSDDALSNTDASKGELLNRKRSIDTSLLNRKQSHDASKGEILNQKWLSDASKGEILKSEQPNDASRTDEGDNKFLSFENENFDDEETPEPT